MLGDQWVICLGCAIEMSVKDSYPRCNPVMLRFCRTNRLVTVERRKSNFGVCFANCSVRLDLGEKLVNSSNSGTIPHA